MRRFVYFLRCLEGRIVYRTNEGCDISGATMVQGGITLRGTATLKQLSTRADRAKMQNSLLNSLY